MKLEQSSTIDEYKSPIAALLWSITLPGFGQVYNGQIIVGVIFMVWELAANVLSDLNMAILYSFHGNFEKAHDIINYEWGMFYPSIWLFSIWQAYNKSYSINASINGTQNRETRLIGLFFGITFGMNLGIYWHFPGTFDSLYIFNFLKSPVFFGLILGILFGLLGYLIERLIRHHHKKQHPL